MVSAQPARPRILAISFSHFAEDARVLRQLAVLADYGDVTTIGYGPKPAGATEHLEVAETLASLPQTALGVLLLALRAHRTVELMAPANLAALRLVGDRRFDLVVANEARALPLAHAVSGGAPVWGDMHEWAPEERTHVLSWRLLVAPFMRSLCARYLPLTDAVTTVNGSIAALYDAQFGTTTEVVRNAIALQDLTPSPVLPGRIRLVHSGGAVPGRNLEALIEATLRLDDRFSLDFYLIAARDGGRYLGQLKKLAGGSPRVSFHDAVKPEALPATLNPYDVGVYVLPPQTTNHRLMLPNKLFDFVQARLAIVFGPAVETSALIDSFGLGVVTPGLSVDDLVDTLAALTEEQVVEFKNNANLAAPTLSSEKDEAVQRGIITRLLGTN